MCKFLSPQFIIKAILSAAIFMFMSITTNIPATADTAKIDDTILARQGYYKLLSHNLGILVDMTKGVSEYDAEAATLAATNLNGLAKVNIDSLYPEGSDNVARANKTRALPKIWEDFAGIKKISGDLVTATTVLAEEAGKGKESLGPAIGGVGEQCKACHDTFRSKTF